MILDYDMKNLEKQLKNDNIDNNFSTPTVKTCNNVCLIKYDYEIWTKKRDKNWNCGCQRKKNLYWNMKLSPQKKTIL